ncbi:helix-turn-helix domain-containing protein [Thalassobius vesicularis]|uniref:Helix-turn-helix domain-containing protein n=1 Tax=Thalassobius vesicularis TaxID=1294297 RepID=A0A4S3M5X1_9RHOB|nr:XRE family transcriptional regulator [Thalassobius vesicularis]THD72064.1 helix-turn-helix domain-containing protein [Thalassobius vesicularis]
MLDDTRLAAHLAALRAAQGWTLADLADRSGLSRATLSRIENAEVSPTAAALGQLCAAFGLSMSQLLAMVESDFRPVIPLDQRASWTDPDTGFTRTVISPAAPPLRGEWLLCTLPADTTRSYDRPPRPGLEHHLLLGSGDLTVTVEGNAHALHPGDCLRYQLWGATEFHSAGGATYLLFLT